MLIFSGAPLPYEITLSQLQRIADVMSVDAGIKILKVAALDEPHGNISLPITVICAAAAICTVLSLRLFKLE